MDSEQDEYNSSEIRDSERGEGVTDRDLLKMASDAVAQTKVEREYLEMYKASTAEMSRLYDDIAGEREKIARYRQQGNQVEIVRKVRSSVNAQRLRKQLKTETKRLAI